jgi:hypothetical protein
MSQLRHVARVFGALGRAPVRGATDVLGGYVGTRVLDVVIRGLGASLGGRPPDRRPLRVETGGRRALLAREVRAKPPLTLLRGGPVFCLSGGLVATIGAYPPG